MYKCYAIGAALLISMLGSGQNLTSPESVEYDMANDRYLISNSGHGNIVAMDQMGTLTTFTTGIPAGPYGLEIMGNAVYACAGGRVRGYDLATGLEVFNLNLSGIFLNGITTDGTYLYVTDFGAQQIFKVDVGDNTFTTLVPNTSGTPNGIHYDPSFGQGMLFVAFWGSNAPVKAYDPITGSPGPVINSGLTNIDGITQDCLGNLYLASWSPDRVTIVDAGSGMMTNSGWTVSNPADIDFDMVSARICIPNTGTNTVTLETVNDCVTEIEQLVFDPSFSISPNPSSSSITVHAMPFMDRSYRIVDLSLREVMAGTLPINGHLEVSMLPAGTYCLFLGGQREYQRFIRADR